jgi:K(+)-stimulated pyrophosphate-energized sodium pump
MSPQNLLFTLISVISVIGLAAAVFFAKWVLAKDTGADNMRKISDAIQAGAEAFMKRMNTTIIYMAAGVAVLVFLFYWKMRATTGEEGVSVTYLAIWTMVAFVLGALCSLVAGYIGMWISIRTNIRTASAARRSLNEALQTALRGGAVSGLLVVVMSLIGVVGLYALVHAVHPTLDPMKIPMIIAGYGFGASFVALFAQLGGGIYTKAADVGADLVGKVEAGIPEDDPRNPAVIADLVGDNVGDCAGRGADLFESSAAENIGSMILGAALAATVPNGDTAFSMGIVGVMLFPLVARAFGILASIIGIFFVSMKEDGDPMAALNRGYYVATVLAAGGFAGACYWLLRLKDSPDSWLWFFGCGLVGIATATAFVYITQYYTEYKYRPVKSIAEASQTGPATNIIAGISVGLECTAIPVIVIGAATLTSFWMGGRAIQGGGLFGTAVATMGMLSTAAFILAMDTFGPITDNAGGIIEMSDQPKEIRDRTDKLDAVGNTTKALTKGYAIGSAALAAFLLFSAYITEIASFGHKIESVNLAEPHIFVAGMLGAMLVFLFSSLAIRAVGKAAYDVINAVRKQFKEHPGILKGTELPDYGACVDLVTVGSLKQMVVPGLLVTTAPLIVGLVFRQFHPPGQPTVSLAPEAVAAFLMVATIAGILMALFFNNGGGAWDNAKKFIETGMYGGKRSDAHKAAVVGDTVGDPFKDTAGPALHVLIKLLSTITLVLAPFFI